MRSQYTLSYTYNVSLTWFNCLLTLYVNNQVELVHLLYLTKQTKFYFDMFVHRYKQNTDLRKKYTAGQLNTAYSATLGLKIVHNV